MAIKIGITGGIGSGKTIVSELLEIMGIPVYYSDIEAKKLTATDPVIREKLVSHFGNQVYENGSLNKSYLASFLFSDKANSRIINGIIHPRVKDHFREWASHHSSDKIIGMESAILIESGFKEEIDITLMVYAPLEVRIERTIQRDKSDRQAILKRIHSQMDDEQKKQMADYVIINDGNTPLIPQVISLTLALSSNY